MEWIGRDASEAFEDVGHSDEARDMLPKMLVGEFKGEVSASYLYFELSCPCSPGLSGGLGRFRVWGCLADLGTQKSNVKKAVDTVSGKVSTSSSSG